MGITRHLISVSFGIEKGKLIGLLGTQRKRKNLTDSPYDRRSGAAGQR